MPLRTIQIINKLPITKAAHNGIYDCTYSITYNAEPSHYLFDTMFFGWSRFSELYQSLDFNASLYLYDYCQWKHEAEDASDKKILLATGHTVQGIVEYTQDYASATHALPSE